MRTLEKSSNVLLSLCTVEQQFSHQSTKYSLFKTYLIYALNQSWIKISKHFKYIQTISHVAF